MTGAAAAALVAAALAAGGSAAAAPPLDPAQGAPVKSAAAAPYVPAAAAKALLPSLTPAPRPGDARDVADRAIYHATRALSGSPRYAMATNDVDFAPAALLRDFACAMGVTLTPSAAPKLTRLIVGASVDTEALAGAAKNRWQRPRPYLAEPGPTCQPPADLAGSFDYPSGHATYGWTWGTLLAELMPGRTAPILARARAFADSRVVCGVHTASAVEAGRETATAVLALVRTSPAYRKDFAAAQRELAAHRDPAPDAATCAAEAALVAERDY